MKLYDINQALAAIAIIVTAIIGLKSFANAMFPSHGTPMTAYMEETLAAAEKATATPAPAAVASGEAPAGDPAADAGAPPSAAASLASLIAAADPAAGASQVGMCKACHTFDKGGRAMMGPNLWGVVGRAKAGSTGFAYSPTLSGLGGAWTYEDLDKFLESPSGFAKGTKMAFAGAKKPEQRAAIIAYLRQQADSPAPLPTE